MAENPPPPFPSPEDLKAKITEFMKQNFGDRVSVATFAEPEPATTEEDDKPEKTDHKEFEFNLLPRDIKAHLDRFVIKQDEAKKVLAIAVCDHYNHANYLRRLEKEDAKRAEALIMSMEEVEKTGAADMLGGGGGGGGGAQPIWMRWREEKDAPVRSMTDLGARPRPAFEPRRREKKNRETTTPRHILFVVS